MKLARTWLGSIALVIGCGASAAHAQNAGFQLDRYEPTTAGTWFFSVDHPWYQSTRWFAGGVTLDYGHDPLVAGSRSGQSFTTQTEIIAHQLVGHVDVATSFVDQFQLSFSLPVTLLERGTAADGVAPIGGAAVGDPRVGFAASIFGRPEKDPFSINLAANLWIPIGAESDHAGDASLRVLPKLILGGTGSQLRWSASVGYLLRTTTSIGNSPATVGNSAGDEVQVGAAIGWCGANRAFNIGPEANLAIAAAQLAPGTSSSTSIGDLTRLEVLLGAQFLIAEQLQIGAAGGIGVSREPGTPDVRVLFRAAWAPLRKPPPPPAPTPPPDRDGDGVLDRDDACPTKAGVRSFDPKRNGCPAPTDRDGDGVFDDEDLCPDVPAGNHPDAKHPGCPIPDRDGDGVVDPDDRCPDVAEGAHHDPSRPGCPAEDRDHDGLFDDEDECPDVAAGPRPDPAKKGCPAADRDHDSVPDYLDACPDQPGAPDPDPQKNGCPGLVQVKNGMIVILQPVFFAENRDVILSKSFPVLQAVANALVAQPDLKRVAVEGHSDNRGSKTHNLDLSQRRANSVMRWLSDHGIAPALLEAHGYGPERPVMPNNTSFGRAANRRVEFHILDPAPPAPTP